MVLQCELIKTKTMPILSSRRIVKIYNCLKKGEAMNLDMQEVPRSPRVEIISNLNKSQKKFSKASSKELISLRHSPKKSSSSSSSSSNNSSNSSSEEESPKIFKPVDPFSFNLTSQLEKLITTVAIEKEEREKKNTELDSTLASLATNHQNILICLKKFKKDKKTILGNNQQQIQESTLIKQRLDDIEKSYEILQNQSQKIVTTTEQNLREQQNVEKILQQQLTSNTDACEQTKKNYTQITERIKKLEQAYDRLVEIQAIIPLLNQIMSTTKLKSATAQIKGNKIAQTNAKTLEDILIEYAEILSASTKKTSTHDDKITALENHNNSLTKQIRWFMGSGVAVFFTSFLIWWHTHKA